MNLIPIKRNGTETATGSRLLFGYLGLFMVMIGAITLLPMFMILIFPNEWRCFPSFLVPGGAAILLGLTLYFLCLFRLEKGKLGKHQDIILLVLLWLMALLIGAFPFFLNQFFVSSPYVTSYSFSEAIFESTSGYTTTGLTIFRDFLDLAVDQADVDMWLAGTCPHIFIFYRSVCHFFGGVGLVLVATSAISDAQGLKLYNAEGHTDKLLPNLKKSARLILVIYFGYIMFGTLLLWLFGMDWFDAMQHSVAALATGGLSSRSTSLYYFLNPMNVEAFSGLSSGCAFSDLSGFNGILPVNAIGIETVSLILMILGATSFMFHLELFTFKWRKLIRDIEIRFALILACVFIPFMMLGFWSYHYGEIDNTITFWNTLRYSVYQFISCLTTTGFSNVPDINFLGPAVLFLSVIAMSIGGSVGSTAGGLKQYRVGIIFKEIGWKFKYRHTNSRFVLPKPICRFGEKRQLKDEEGKEAFIYAALYISIVFIGTLILACLPNITFDEAIYEASSSISSAGNSMINFCIGSSSYKLNNPIASYNLLLWVCIFLMFLGRLEIVPIVNAVTGTVRRIARKDIDAELLGS